MFFLSLQDGWPTRTGQKTFEKTKNQLKALKLMLSILGLGLGGILAARNLQAKANPYFNTYSGIAIREPLLNTIRFSIPETGQSAVSVLSLGAPFFQLGSFSLEGEAQLGTHYEGEDSFQANAVLVKRFHRLPWERFVPGSSFALGNGISHTFKPPQVEREVVKNPSNLLYYLMLEFTFPLFGPENRFELLTRVHHRSGVFGLIGNSKEGSNFICLGLRYSL